MNKIIFLKFLCIYFFFTVRSPYCCLGFSLVVASGGYSLVAVRELISVTFLVVSTGSRAPGLQ